MMMWARRKFTEWYIKRGYTFSYDFSETKTVGEYPFYFPFGVPKTCFVCPVWVKPFLFLFSPSIYTAGTLGKIFIEGFMEGLNDPHIKPIHFENLH